MTDVRASALRKWGFVGIGVVLGLVAAWFLLPQFMTPEQAEEARDVPAPEPVTAPVEEGVLREVIQMEGVVVPVESLWVPGPRPLGPDRSVITYVPPVGSTIGAGDLVLGVSDRPVVYLGEHQNLYRDLYRGLSGPDVASFQGFLVDSGHLEVGSFESGVFGAETEDAVELLYIGIGYRPARLSAVNTEEDRREARNSVSEARGTLRAAQQGGDEQTIATATRRLEIEERRLEALSANPRLHVPVDEFVGLAHDTVVVVGSPFRRGAVVDVGTPVLEVRTESVVLRATMSRLRGSGVAPGHVALVKGPSGETTTVVERVGPLVGDPGLLEVIIAWVLAATPGERYLVEIEIARTEARVLSVPVSAVRSAGDGTAYVTILEAGDSRRVTVALGVTYGGRTEVVGDLRPGQQVIVGQR